MMMMMNTSRSKLSCSSEKKRQRLHIPRLDRRWRILGKQEVIKENVKKMVKKKSKQEEMMMKNLKLYMENESIIQENERLRNKALLLHQENKSLLEQLQQQASHKP